jgi:uncharacterized protein YrrD
MLRSTKKLTGFTIRGTDGDVGTLDDLLFDDEKWAIRYIVVNTGGWLGRRVLISPMSFSSIDWEGGAIDLSLTKERIRNSPDADPEGPISREFERGFYAYYGYPLYWDGPGFWGPAPYPGALAAAMAADDQMDPGGLGRLEERPDSHVRSARTLLGNHIQAADGEIGHVDDLIVDDESWAIRYLRIDTSNWIGGKAVLVPQRALEEVNWLESKVHVSLTREQVKNSPEYDGDLLNREDDERLAAHYGF